MRRKARRADCSRGRTQLSDLIARAVPVPESRAWWQMTRRSRVSRVDTEGLISCLRADRGQGEVQEVGRWRRRRATIYTRFFTALGEA